MATGTLYIANCSKQNHDFLWYAPESKKAVMQQIPMGGQIVASKPGENMEVLRAIIAQYEMYGLIDVSQISGIRQYAGLCYSFDKPVPVEKIMYVNDSNDAALTAAGVKLRQESAAALSNSLESAEGASGVRHLETETIEVNERGVATGMHENIEVVHTEDPAPSRSRNRRRGR